MTEIPDEYMEQIKKEFAIMKETDDLNANLSQVLAEVHSIFLKHGISKIIYPSEVMFGRKHFGNSMHINVDIKTRENVFVYAPNLSEIIFDHYYPRPKSKKFFHFTTLDSAIKIMNAGHFRVYNLLKNYDFDEFRTFYKDHNLDGFSNSYSHDGDLYEEHIMKQTFSLCLTNDATLSKKQENYLWQVFAAGNTGVKLELEINSNHIDLREIFYKDNSISKNDLLLNELDIHFKSKYNRQFALSKISKIGGFYLPSRYEIENETRFLIKEHTEDYDFNFIIHPVGNGIAYIELPFNNQFGIFNIKHIHLGVSCDLALAHSEFSKLGFGNIIVNP